MIHVTIHFRNLVFTKNITYSNYDQHKKGECKYANMYRRSLYGIIYFSANHDYRYMIEVIIIHKGNIFLSVRQVTP